MASRRETRLPHAGNPLAEAEIQLGEPQTGKIDQEELVRIFTTRESTISQASANTLDTRPPRNVIETNYAFESCRPFYQERVEAANTGNTLDYSGPTERSVKVQTKTALSEYHHITSPACEDSRLEALLDPDSGTSLPIQKIWPPALGNSPAEKLADDLRKSFVSKSKNLPQFDGTDERGPDEGLIKPTPRHPIGNQTSPFTPATLLCPTQDPQQSSSTFKLARIEGAGNGSRTIGYTSSIKSPSARTSDFENHTRLERSLSRASTHENSAYHNLENTPAGSSPHARKQPNTPFTSSSRLQMELSSLLGIAGRDRRSMLSSSDLGPSLTHENLALEVVDPSANKSAADLASEQTLGLDIETILNVEDSSAASKYQSFLESHINAGHLTPLDYSELNPEVLPTGYTSITYIRSVEEKHNNQLQHLAHRLSSLTAHDVEQLVRSGQLQTVLELAKTAWPIFPRVFNPRPFKRSSNAPPICHPRSDADAWPDNIPIDLLENLATNYLSHTDVRNLRLVNKPMSASFSPIYFRSLVTRFGLGMFAPSQQYGNFVNRFGISFEIDLPSLYKAKNKVSQEMQQSWWGDYTWPKPAYQRFPELKALEDLVDDNKPLLKKTLQNLTNASELALSIDSGHGWLNGPDLSDLQVWEMRQNGSKVFGKTFKAVDKWEEHLRDEVFCWAQQNTINQSIKYLVERSTTENSVAFNRTRSKLRWLQAVRIRNYESFEVGSEQADQDANHHTGGTPRPAPAHGPAAHNQLVVTLANVMGNAPANNNIQPPGTAPLGLAVGAMQAQLQLQHVVPPAHGTGPGAPGTAAPRQRPAARRMRPGRRASSPKRPREPHVPQWPLIFNGYNLAAELGGQNTYIQDKIASPVSSLIKPGHLSEAQAQWLMETFWAQRAFLSAYTTSVILNKANLGKIHALNIAKLSSGLLPLLEQHEFWRALPGLRILSILISPDWRQEHIPGDKSFQSNMLISPIRASIKLTDFLQRFICNLENLSKLTVGFVGGGEHAPGMLARNQHVLPAPITQHPRSWLSDHHTTPPTQTMISFNHIEELKFSNCWFSPCMLLAFLEKSRDTSLRHLILDSVSLTAHGASSVGSNGIATPISAQYGTEAWLNETLPNKGCWPAILDEVTPGMTFLEQKEALGFHLNEENQQLLHDKSFRGNVQEITLNSCGYAHVSGVMVEELNQSELLRAQPGALDEGLAARKQALQAGQHAPRSRRLRPAHPGNANPPPIPVIDSRPGTPQDISGRLMMGVNDAHGHEYFGLGTLTQAVHPVEKRVLEQAWGMRFGWGDDMNRWSAVDDGFYEGGTGRFSGSILK